MYKRQVYQFLPHAYKYNFLNAWRLEAVRLRKKGLPVFGWQNELIWWYLLSLALLVGFGWAFEMCIRDRSLSIRANDLRRVREES